MSLDISVKRPDVGAVYNLCPNPKFEDNVTDFWNPADVVDENTGIDTDPQRITNPPVALPSGVNACLRWRLPYWGSSGWWTDRVDLPDGVNKLHWSVEWWSQGLGYNGQLPFFSGFTPQFYDADDNVLAYTADGSADGVGYPGAGFKLATSPTYRFPSSARSYRMAITVLGGQNTTSPACYLYFTKTMVSNDESADYADGDTSGWQWIGTPENSMSKTAVLMPRTGYHLSRGSVDIGVARPEGGSSEFNFVVNPRFHESLDDWLSTGVVSERVTAPPVAMASQFDACALLYYGNGQAFWAGGTLGDDVPEGIWAASYEALAYNGVTDVQFVLWYDGGVVEAWSTPVANNLWNRLTSILSPPSRPTAWRLSFLLPSSVDTPEEGLYVTGVRVGPQKDYAPQEYADGDSPGWRWLGYAHEAVSVEDGQRVETFNVGRDENGLTISVAPKPVVSGGGGD